jgi:hypothetical protein
LTELLFTLIKGYFPHEEMQAYGIKGKKKVKSVPVNGHEGP